MGGDLGCRFLAEEGQGQGEESSVFFALGL